MRGDEEEEKRSRRVRVRQPDKSLGAGESGREKNATHSYRDSRQTGSAIGELMGRCAERRLKLNKRREEKKTE